MMLLQEESERHTKQSKIRVLDQILSARDKLLLGLALGLR
jgi:hypothetical protein